MSHDYSTEQERPGTRWNNAAQTQQSEHANGAAHIPVSLLDDTTLRGRGNTPARHSLMRNMQQTHGNRAVQRQVHRSAPTSVQRSVWDDTNLKDDFWGLKSGLGDKWGGVADAGISAAWNLGGSIPGPIGASVSMLGTGVDLAKFGYAAYKGDDAAAERFSNDATLSALGLVKSMSPVGIAATAYDVAATGGRALGMDVPTTGDIWHNIWSGDMPTVPNQGGHGGGPQSYPEDVPVPAEVPAGANDGGHGGGPQNYLSANSFGGGAGGSLLDMFGF